MKAVSLENLMKLSKSHPTSKSSHWKVLQTLAWHRLCLYYKSDKVWRGKRSPRPLRLCLLLPQDPALRPQGPRKGWRAQRHPSPSKQASSLSPAVSHRVTPGPAARGASLRPAAPGPIQRPCLGYYSQGPPPNSCASRRVGELRKRRFCSPASHNP